MNIISISFTYFICTNVCHVHHAGMASKVPSFVKRSSKYEDIFGSKPSGKTSSPGSPVSATPISRLPALQLDLKKTASSSRKRDLQTSLEPSSGSGSRSSKKPKLPIVPSHQTSSPPSKVQQFCNMIDGQVPKQEIHEWDMLK